MDDRTYTLDLYDFKKYLEKLENFEIVDIIYFASLELRHRKKNNEVCL